MDPEVSKFLTQCGLSSRKFPVLEAPESTPGLFSWISAMEWAAKITIRLILKNINISPSTEGMEKTRRSLRTPPDPQELQQQQPSSQQKHLEKNPSCSQEHPAASRIKEIKNLEINKRFFINKALV